MSYISATEWRDLTDHHLYRKGDPFPHDGREIPADRIESLTTTRNKAGFAVIEAVAVADEGKPTETAETPKKAVRGRKKATPKTDTEKAE